MQINAINNLNFEGKFNKSNKTQNKPVNNAPEHRSNGFMKSLTGPAAVAMFLIPIANSCNEDIIVKAEAGASIELPYGRDTIQNPDTIIKTDTVYNNDTIIKHDTIYIPPEFEFPYEIQDSLNTWRGDILDIDVEGDDIEGDYKNKALVYLQALRDWEFQRPESLKLNLAKSDATEARYDHNIADSIINDIRITKVNPGDLTVVKKDGTITNQVSGLLFNEDGQKTFMHSNGKDKIYIYPKATSGQYNGKYVELGSAEKGFMPKDKFGQSILLNDMLSEGSIEHYINVEGNVVDVADLMNNPRKSIVIRHK